MSSASTATYSARMAPTPTGTHIGTAADRRGSDAAVAPSRFQQRVPTVCGPPLSVLAVLTLVELTLQSFSHDSDGQLAAGSDPWPLRCCGCDCDGCGQDGGQYRDPDPPYAVTAGAAMAGWTPPAVMRPAPGRASLRWNGNELNCAAAASAAHPRVAKAVAGVLLPGAAWSPSRCGSDARAWSRCVDGCRQLSTPLSAMGTRE